MKLIIGIVLIVFITGCVLINGSINKNDIYTTNVVEKETSELIPDLGCSLSDYKHLIKVPEIPALDKSKIDDRVYTETFLTEVMNEHRILLKELKKELDRCSQFK